MAGNPRLLAGVVASHLPQLPAPLISAGFGALFALLIASFYFLPDQAGRNLLLYLTALSAHGLLARRRSWSLAYGQAGGWVVLLLVVVPLLSLSWSTSVGVDRGKDLLVAGYCVVTIYVGVAWLLNARPALVNALAGLMIVSGNLAAAASLLGWALTLPTADNLRLEGLWGIDNPVHASVLLLGGTLPLLSQVLRGHRSRWWLMGLVLPLGFVALAGARTATAAYLLVVVVVAASWRPRAATWVLAGAALLAAGAVWLLGPDAVAEVWLGRGLSFRDVLWDQVWDAYRECNALLGCGIASPLSLEFAGHQGDRAHSIFLAALYHQGLLGFAAFLAALGWLLWQGLRPDLAGDGAARGWAWMLGFVLLANLTSGDHVLVRGGLFWPCFWMPVMVLAAMRRESSPPAPP